MHVTKTELLILNLLSEVRERYGLEMVKASNGKLKRGTVYVLLNRLADKGLVDSRLVDPPAGTLGSPRRLYSITGSGQKARDAYSRLEIELGGLEHA